MDILKKRERCILTKLDEFNKFIKENDITGGTINAENDAITSADWDGYTTNTPTGEKMIRISAWFSSVHPESKLNDISEFLKHIRESMYFFTEEIKKGKIEVLRLTTNTDIDSHTSLEIVYRKAKA